MFAGASSVGDKITILGWLYVAVCGAGLVIGAALCVGFVLSPAPQDAYAQQVAGPIFFGLAVVYLIPGLLGGIGLLFARRWARVLISIESAMFLLLFPVGTVLGAFGLWVLLNEDAPAMPALDAPALAGSGAGGVMLAMAGVASGFVVVIGTGYRLSGEPAPVEISSIYYGSIGVFALVIGLAIAHWARLPRRAFGTHGGLPWSGADRAGLARARLQSAEQRRQRLAVLAQDPLKRKYVALIERGEAWSDAQIDYNEDVERAATCLHLQPIERAMRAVGIRVRLEIPPSVRAECCVDPIELQRRFEPPEWVKYSELARYDRSLEDPPGALIACTVCKSRIDVLHRREAGADTPVFPPANGGQS